MADVIQFWEMQMSNGLHIGPGNTSMTYQMGGTILSITVNKNTSME